MAHSSLEQLKLLIGSVCAVDPATVDRNARLRGYGLDSVRITELMLTIEDEFHVTLPIERMGEIASVGELALFVDKLIAG